MTKTILEVDDLWVRFGDVHALRGVNLSLKRGESLAVVGESGAGKSTLAHALVGLVQPPVARGKVRVEGEEMIGADPDVLRSMRWTTVAITLQGKPFNPVATVLAQIAEPLIERAGATRPEAEARAYALAGEVDLDPQLLHRFPHELSGGEKGRASLAMALVLDPKLIVLDEPTAGLDPRARRSMLALLGELVRTKGVALVLLTHDLAAAAAITQRSMILYAGEAMEVGDSQLAITRPAHPYSWALVRSYPVLSTTKDLRPIRGNPPDPSAVPSGCPFHPRCIQAEQVCRDEHPELESSRGRLVACHFGGLKTLMSVSDVTKTFRSAGRSVSALQGVSLSIAAGESVAIVGPSGSGKSTLARIVWGRLAPDSGSFFFDGAEQGGGLGPARARRRWVQLIMQDPWDALSPRLAVEEIIREPLDISGDDDRDDRTAAVADALSSVGLPSSGPFLAARTHELSGGQLQRISLARALVARPRLLIADEPTSMLDSSEQARLLLLLRERQIEMGLGLLLVSHDLALVRKVTDRIIVLDEGRVVEEGLSETITTAPRSATARALVEAAPAFPLDAGGWESGAEAIGEER